mmetsp:Transcript_2997/g.6990  ORF Transcript_2997/g.6990 Transcript_2997/m.6990 type:complete len:266 (+) Transcript_2997:28-825(+)
MRLMRRPTWAALRVAGESLTMTASCCTLRATRCGQPDGVQSSRRKKGAPRRVAWTRGWVRPATFPMRTCSSCATCTGALFPQRLITARRNMEAKRWMRTVTANVLPIPCAISTARRAAPMGIRQNARVSDTLPRTARSACAWRPHALQQLGASRAVVLTGMGTASAQVGPFAGWRIRIAPLLVPTATRRTSKPHATIASAGRSAARPPTPAKSSQTTRAIASAPKARSAIRERSPGVVNLRSFGNLAPVVGTANAKKRKKSKRRI